MGEKNIIFLIIVFILATISADVISINSGGSTDLVITPDNYIEGFFSCIPMNCTQLGYNCDSWSDTCGKTINCGSCSSGYTCTLGVCTITPVPPPPSGPSGGGGGGKPTKPKLIGLRVIPDSFNIATIANRTSSAKIDLLNNGDSDLDLSVSLTSSLNDIILFTDETSFTLIKGSSKTLTFQITSPASAGIYTGKIIFSSDGRILEVPFVLNVRSGISLFDISLDIPEENRIIKLGENLKGQITLIQAGLQEPTDVAIHYIVKDFEDNVYLEESETIMVYKQKSYEHEFNTQNLPVGDYVIGAEVIYEGGVATASYPFEVVEKEITSTTLIYILLLAIFIMAIIAILLIVKYYKQMKLRYKKGNKRGKKRR